MAKDPRILYFCAGSAPTAKDKLAALALGSNVAFRNGSVGTGGAALETCDGVSGPAVPKEYRAKPDGAECFEAYRAKLIADAESEMQAAESAVKAEAEAKTQKQASKPQQQAGTGEGTGDKPQGAPVGNPGAAGAWGAGR